VTQPKSIFITGAAAGIGKATALLFAKRHWFVGLFDIQEEALTALGKQIGPGNSCFRITNVADPQSVRAAADVFAEHTDGRMDVLFNNAGVLRMGRFEALDLADHKATLDVNIGGVINCVHTCLGMLKNTPGAHIVNMSSASAIYGTPELSSYSASKFAVRSLTESLNLELERYGIMVCDVMPGYVKTPMIMNQEYKAGSVDRLGVTLAPEQVAEEVWRAAHETKVHRYMGHMLRVTEILSAFTPVMRRAMRNMIRDERN